MSGSSTKREKITRRINRYVGSDAPFRQLAGDLSKTAKYAINEAETLSLERIDITIDALPKRLEGFRIVHLSDLHHSPFTSLEHITNAISAANTLDADLAVLTGDYVSHDASYIDPVAEAVGSLNARFGIFACLGNHDHWTDAEMITRSLESAGVNVLVNEGLRLDADGSSFWLGGVDDHMVGKVDLPAALRGSFPDEMKILLAHNPIIFRHAVRAGIDLTLSGHTHGGQVKVRDTEKRLLRRRRLSSGLHKRKNSQIYITRGIGTVVLPVRFQCPPEISLLTLHCGETKS